MLKTYPTTEHNSAEFRAQEEQNSLLTIQSNILKSPEDLLCTILSKKSSVESERQPPPHASTHFRSKQSRCSLEWAPYSSPYVVIFCLSNKSLVCYSKVRSSLSVGGTQLAECLPTMHQALGSTRAPCKLGGIIEVQVQSCMDLYGFECQPGYISPVSKTTTKTRSSLKMSDQVIPEHS